jgi:hypothetical protein
MTPPSLNLNSEKICKKKFNSQNCRKYLFESVGIHDFSIFYDLLKPEPKRFRHHISAIINFERFQQRRVEKYNELELEFVQKRLFKHLGKFGDQKRQIG